MSQLDSEIQQLVVRFQQDLTRLIHKSITNAVLELVQPGVTGAGAAPSKAPAKRAKKSAKKRAVSADTEGAPAKKTAKKAAKKKAAKKKKTAKKAASAKATGKKTSGRVKKGTRTSGGWIRRSPEYLQQLEDRFYQEVKRGPDRRIEELGEALGEPTKNLALPAKKLIEAGKLKTRGVKRATRYSVA